MPQLVMVYKISNIFLSIQGEGIGQGEFMVFIRLYGCNLNCNWCDTDYAKEGEYTTKSIETIIERVKEYLPCRKVYITGGEPLEQDLLPLIATLREMEYEIWVDTNGSKNIKELSKQGVHIVLDRKLPSSGMASKMFLGNFVYLGEGDQIKYVIATEKDYEIAKQESTPASATKVFSPCFETESFKPEITPAELVEKMKKDKLFYIRYSLQIHKIIWEPAQKGV